MVGHVRGSVEGDPFHYLPPSMYFVGLPFSFPGDGGGQAGGISCPG